MEFDLSHDNGVVCPAELCLSLPNVCCALHSLQILTDTPHWHPPLCSVSLPAPVPPPPPQLSHNTTLACSLSYKAPKLGMCLLCWCQDVVSYVCSSGVLLCCHSSHPHSRWQTVHSESADGRHTPAWLGGLLYLLCCLPASLSSGHHLLPLLLLQHLHPGTQ